MLQLICSLQTVNLLSILPYAGNSGCQVVVAQARGVLGSTPSGYRPFHFPLFKFA